MQVKVKVKVEVIAQAQKVKALKVVKKKVVIVKVMKALLSIEV